jgi:polysaccharide export outer membrane protein
MTLIEALARAGSTTERAGVEVVILRPSATAGTSAGAEHPDTPGGDTIRVNLESLQRGGTAQNVALRGGDTISVPRAETVFVSGQVRAPGEYVIRRMTTVRQALAVAGGVTDRGSTRRVQVIRVIDDKEVTMDVDLQTPVQAGDTIVVNERFF